MRADQQERPLPAVPGGLRTIPQAAAELGLSERNVWSLKERGEIPHVRIGRRVLFTEADIAAFIARSRVTS